MSSLLASSSSCCLLRAPLASFMACDTQGGINGRHGRLLPHGHIAGYGNQYYKSGFVIPGTHAQPGPACELSLAQSGTPDAHVQCVWHCNSWRKDRNLCALTNTASCPPLTCKYVPLQVCAAMNTLWSPLLGGSLASAAVAPRPMMGTPKLLRAAARLKAAWARSRAVSGLQYCSGSCSSAVGVRGQRVRRGCRAAVFTVNHVTS
jgi:hypothetical protein